MTPLRPFRLALALLAALTAAGAAAQVPAYDSLTVASAALGEARHVNVYTPPGYSASERPRYPVLYMPDGGTQEDFGHVSAALDAAIRAGEARPMLLVGVENTERRRDMTGPTTVDSDREIAPRVGGSAAFRAFFRDELMPEVRRRYRVST
ncbi:MAG TPA: alpha/beta hydrolase-fold protein, partial [Rhodothermales bacterium]|nr:alpha/beta hydrolase-fold protein [Rhodothermales bacterium]